MKTYAINQFAKYSQEDMERIQKTCDNEDLDYIEQHKEELLQIMHKYEYEEFKENYTNTMQKMRLLCDAIVQAFSTEHTPGFPEYIYNIDLKDGSIETDKNNRKISYSTDCIAPCTTTMLHYINHNSNNVFVIFPPIKSIQRSIEKILSERIRERQEKRDEELSKFEGGNLEEEPELPLTYSPKQKRFILNSNISGCPTKQLLNPQHQENLKKTENTLVNWIKEGCLPKDIYRLTITANYPEELEKLIKDLEEKFPSYIKFDEGERNLYKEKLSKNKRSYFDIKKSATITIPNTNIKFKIEFQFKQTNMFFAHIRSHEAYEEYRKLEADYLKQRDLYEKKKTVEAKKKMLQLRKQCEEKKILCVKIHRNAVHQSNMYLMNKILWLDDNARGLRRLPSDEEGRYDMSIETLRKNYIVEDYTPFDGATEFATSDDEYLNKSYYLKLIGILPESFDELGKNAKEKVTKTWATLTDADIKTFDRITSTAIKYQDIIRNIQKRRHIMDDNAILNAMAEFTRS
ncbi:MAG: hypothetical protein IJE43_09010 [Alphaproteobacteria bacterium]|nr:hypothetical protein [Alphaproteobacteria bacterium]